MIYATRLCLRVDWLLTSVLAQSDIARSAKETAEQAVLDLDAAYRQRIVYLELWKKGACTCWHDALELSALAPLVSLTVGTDADAAIRLKHMSDYIFRIDPMSIGGTGSTGGTESDVQKLRDR